MKTRLIYLSLTVFCAWLAMFTRTDVVLPNIIKVYGGDTVWAIMTYFLICFVLPKCAGKINLLLALIVSYSVESMQLYQAPWIFEIRATKLGGLALGHGFKVSDLVCYTLGNITGFLMDSTCRFYHYNRKNNDQRRLT